MNERQLEAMTWEDKQNIHMLMDINIPTGEGSFSDEHGKVLQYILVED
jgi:hypothetical protein